MLLLLLLLQFFSSEEGEDGVAEGEAVEAVEAVGPLKRRGCEASTPEFRRFIAWWAGQRQSCGGGRGRERGRERRQEPLTFSGQRGELSWMICMM